MSMHLTSETVSILEAMEDCIYLVNEDYVVVFMNEVMKRDFGDGLGRKCFEVIKGFEGICDDCRLEDVLKGESVNKEVYIDFVGKHFSLVEKPIKNKDGTISKLGIFKDITSFKKNEIKILESEEEFKRLFENARTGLYESNKEGKMLNANQYLLDMLRYESKEEFMNIDISRDLYLKPDDRQIFMDKIEKDGFVIDYEVDFKRKDGTPIPVLLTSHVCTDRDKKVLGYEGIIVDQTQRKQIEADYMRLFEHVGCGVFISSKEGKFINANKALIDMLGYGNKEEFLSIDIAKDLYEKPGDRKIFIDLIEREGRVIDHEVSFKRKDGSAIPVLLTGHVRYGLRGKVLGYEGINIDLSQRKKMEKELKEAHDFLDNFIRNSPNAIMASDMKGNILLWNKSAEEMLEYSGNEVIGKMNISKVYPAGIAKQVMKMMRSSEYGGVGKLKSYPMTYRRRDGETIEGSLSATIIYDERGKEMASVGEFVDLKERLEMEMRLRETQEQLLQSEKLAAMGKLTSQIAHELNNPLYGIMNTLELLKTEVPAHNKRRKILDMALSETVRLTELLRKMLSFSKPDEEERQQVGINNIIDEILLLVGKQLQEYSIKITTSFGENLPRVFASKNQLRQVFLNFISNARDAMPEGGTFSVRTWIEKGYVRIEMSDTGSGIDPVNIDRIFEAFFTTKDKVKGVGLGLSVCYGFIKDHGGDISVESNEGEGTTFVITLPVYKEDNG